MPEEAHEVRCIVDVRRPGQVRLLSLTQGDPCSRHARFRTEMVPNPPFTRRSDGSILQGSVVRADESVLYIRWPEYEALEKRHGPEGRDQPTGSNTS